MSVCTDRPAPDSPLALLLATFALRPDAAHVAADPKGNCGAIAVRFAEAAQAAGLDAKVRAFDQWEDDPKEWDKLSAAYTFYANWSLARHFTVAVTDHEGIEWDVDWAARQFDPDAPFPKVVPADCCDDCLLPAGDEPHWAVSDLHDLEEACSESIDVVARADLPPADPATTR